ncbi:hypothetical protein CBS147352_10966 [Aspergillus niger]|nr:hypothetical protein CBS147345_11029 [Aspergillus niger]KAI3037609.1 hypothetical protein CBS147352_10966 [Aspergillus niger]
MWVQLASQVLEVHPLCVVELIAPLQVRFYEEGLDLGRGFSHVLHPAGLVELVPLGGYIVQVTCVPGAIGAEADMQCMKEGEVVVDPREEGFPGDRSSSCTRVIWWVDVHPELEVVDFAADGGWEGGEEGETFGGGCVEPDFVAGEQDLAGFRVDGFAGEEEAEG